MSSFDLLAYTDNQLVRVLFYIMAVMIQMYLDTKKPSRSNTWRLL